jgi:hypothetical protein
MYINGTQVGADKPLTNLVLSDTSMDLTIGSAGTNWHFRGLIDEVAILKVGLEEEEIQTIMNEGLEKSSGLTAVLPSDKLTTTWGDVK